MQSDAIFWERLAGMPIAEAEQELVLRREHIASEAADLLREKIAAEACGNKAAALAIGRQMFDTQSRLTLVGERIKYLRRTIDSLQWRKAVFAVLGADAHEACAAWIVQQDEGAAFRGEWAKVAR